MNTSLSAIAVAVVLSSSVTAANAAREFYVTIEGVQQGKFKGESLSQKQKDKIPAISFDYNVTSPRDVATGQVSGKRQHSPIKITKEWGAATPQLFQALTNNEALKSVLFEFVRPTAQGSEEVYQTIKLTNAAISSIRWYTGEAKSGTGASSQNQRELEEISFTFQQIEIENKPGGTMASDGLGQGTAMASTPAAPPASTPSGEKPTLRPGIVKPRIVIPDKP